jgi:hypothetical protein
MKPSARNKAPVSRPGSQQSVALKPVGAALGGERRPPGAVKSPLKF